jgi:oligo-1,6-glucosidase
VSQQPDSDRHPPNAGVDPWWKSAVVYQIYPWSFADSNGDGIGDLRGIIGRLDYLCDLGIDVVWLSPVYRSPNDDMGYDISDYREIMTEFGTLADWDELAAGIHERGMRLVMDLVVNHTSDEHPWFLASRSSRDNPYRDYYYWREGRDGREPNNWLSIFGGPAWVYDELTGEWYLHLFSDRQPDLNWENPRVRAEVYDLMRWWLDRGVDGFRMDVINAISKVDGLPDAPERLPGRYQWAGEFFWFGPRLLEFLTEMKREALDGYDTMTVGETPTATTEQAIALTNSRTGPLNMIFQFEHMEVDAQPDAPPGVQNWRPWTLDELKAVMSRWQDDLYGRGWNSLYLSNHDQPRQVSRFGNDGRYRVQSATMLATFLHFLQGTPYVYQGEEIGMTNVAFPSIEDYRDVWTRNSYRELTEERGVSAQDALTMVHRKSRDNARTPMQWDAGPHAGFTSGEPWIGVNPNYREVNVEAALADRDSVLHYYRRLIALRKQHRIMVDGRYALLDGTDGSVWAYTRTLGDERMLVILNFGDGTPSFAWPANLPVDSAELLIANYPAEGDAVASIALRPYEARVYHTGGRNRS